MSVVGQVRRRLHQPSEGSRHGQHAIDRARVIGSIDTHHDLHTAAGVDASGDVLVTQAFATTRAGYRAMLAWFSSFGPLLRVGVEATGTYGAGIARHMARADVPVLEVTGPDRSVRRGARQG